MNKFDRNLEKEQTTKQKMNLIFVMEGENEFINN